MSNRISPLQVQDATKWKGLTTKNNLGAMWGLSTQKVSNMIMKIQENFFGNNIDSILATLPTMKFETNDDFQWQLTAPGVDNYPLHECRIGGVAITPVDAPGENNTEFELVFHKGMFSAGEIIVGEMNEIYPVRIKSETMDGEYSIYTCEMNGGPDLFLPYEEAVRGMRWSGEYALVSDTMSEKGREVRYKSHLSMKNSFSQIRVQKSTPGNMSKRKVGSYFMGEDGKAVRFWHQYESFMLDNAFREDINKLLMFGTSNKSGDGKYRVKDDSGYEIKQGAGIREQMQASNTSYYNVFSIESLSSRLFDLSEGKTQMDSRSVVLRTGERGAYEFHKSLEKHSQLFTPLQNTDRMYKVASGSFKMGLGYGGQFIEFTGPNGQKVSLSVDSMYDDKNRNKKTHPTKGGRAESYRYDIMDFGTSEGSPNIQKVESEADPIAYKYIPGMRHPFSPDGAVSIAGTAKDAWEEHKMYTGATIVKDPSRTASFIHSSQAA